MDYQLAIAADWGEIGPAVKPRSPHVPCLEHGGGVVCPTGHGVCAKESDHTNATYAWSSCTDLGLVPTQGFQGRGTSRRLVRAVLGRNRSRIPIQRPEAS